MYSFSKRTKRAPIAVIDLTGDENLAPAQRPSNPVLSARSNPVPTEENRYNPYQRGSMKVDLSPSLNVPTKPLAENHWPSQYNQYNTMDWNEYFKRNQTLGMEQHFGMNTNFGSHQMASPHFPPNSWTGQSSSSQPLPPYVYDQINAFIQQQYPKYYHSPMFYTQMLHQQQQFQQQQNQQQEHERQYRRQLLLRLQQQHEQKQQEQQRQQQAELPNKSNFFWYPWSQQ